MTIDPLKIKSASIDQCQSAADAGNTAETSSANERTSSVGEDPVSSPAWSHEIDRVTLAVKQARRDRVAAVKKALAEGTYAVAGEDIARALIQSRSKR